MACIVSIYTAALYLKAGGSVWLKKAGSHGNGADRRVPHISRMLLFNCALTKRV